MLPPDGAALPLIVGYAGAANAAGAVSCAAANEDDSLHSHSPH